MADDAQPEQLRLMQRLVEMSAERSEMSAERCYMAAERTLSAWIRTALAVIVAGVAIDRFGLILRRLAGDSRVLGSASNTVSSWTGAALVALGVLMAVTTGWRFWAYATDYRRRHRDPVHHGPFLAPLFALLTAIFGVALLVIIVFVLA